MVSWMYGNKRWIVLFGFLLQVLCIKTEDLACNQPLGMQDGRITDDMIKVSSTKPGSNKTYARYGCCADKSDGAFCTNKADNHTWLEVHFGSPTAISGITVQSPHMPNHGNYLKTFHLLYKPQGRSHLEYLSDKDGPAVVPAPNVSNSGLRVNLPKLVTDTVRIEIEKPEGEACFRFELSGCNAKDLCPNGCDNGGSCDGDDKCACPPHFQGRWCEVPIVPLGNCTSPIGMESGKITDSQLTVSSTMPGKEKEKARWNCCKEEEKGAWCPADSDKSSYFKVTFDKPLLVGAVGMQFPTRKALTETETTYLKTYDLEIFHGGQHSTLSNLTAAYNATTSELISFHPVTTEELKIVPQTFVDKPCFRFELYTCDPNDKCPLGCKNEGRCLGPNHCECAGGFAGESCQYNAISVEVHLQIKFTFELIIGTTLVTPNHNITLHGNPKLIDGRFGKALLLNGNGQYAEIQKKDLGCIANIDRCRSGFTLSMDVNFISIREGMYLFSSGGDTQGSTGVSCRVQNARFVVTVSTSTQMWQGGFPVGTIKTNAWVKMEFSWSLTEGLTVYTNHKLVFTLPKPTGTRPRVYTSHTLCLGSTPIEIETKVFGEFIIENYKTWFVSKKAIADTGVNVKCPDECMNNGTCTDQGKCQCQDGYEGSVCQFRKNTIQYYNLVFVNAASLVVNGKWLIFGAPEKHHGQNNEITFVITNVNHYLELNSTINAPCLSDINLCFTGFTYHLKLKVAEWVDNTYIISGGGVNPGTYGVSFFYASNKLNVQIRTSSQTWQVQFASIPIVNEWHSVEFSWSHQTGLVVYLNNTIVGSDVHPVSNGTAANKTYPIHIGAPVETIAGRENPHFEVSSIQVWFATRNVLEGFKFLPKAERILPSQTGSTTRPTDAPTTENLPSLAIQAETKKKKVPTATLR